MSSYQGGDDRSGSGSVKTTMSKAGVHRNKHCFTGTCNGRPLAGAGAARHIKGHPEEEKKMEKCFGDQCGHCSAYQQAKGDQNGKAGKHKLLLCSQCNKNKDSRYVDKESGICQVCAKGGSKSVGGSVLNKSVLGKRARVDGEEKKEEDDVKTISDELDGMNIDEGANHVDGAQINTASRSKAKRPNTNQVVRLSGQALKKLPEFSMEQSSLLKNDFEVPYALSQPQVIIQTQGQRDQQAIMAMRAINNKQDQTDPSLVNELIQYIPLFAQEIVILFFDQEKDSLQSLKKLLILVMKQANPMDIESLVALSFVSVLLQGPLLKEMASMFNSLDSNTLKAVLSGLKLLLSKKFKPELAEWWCLNWKLVDEQTLILLSYLSTPDALQFFNAAEIATISLMVNIHQEVSKFALATKVFSKYTFSYKLFLDKLIASLPTLVNNYQKFTYMEYALLAQQLEQNQNQQLIVTNAEQLKSLPLLQWFSEISSLQASSLIQDCDSVQYQIDHLVSRFKPLPKEMALSLLEADERYKTTFFMAGVAPNNLQFANAQYGAGSIEIYPKQLLQVGSGQGKSRIMASLALILLLSTKSLVHMVFPNEYLMNRDKKDFEIYWKLRSMEDRVVYHSNLDFMCGPADIMICDEADAFIFSDPTKFQAFILDKMCICLTATLGSADSRGVEQKVITAMEFTTFISDAVVKEAAPSIRNSLSLKVSSDEELLHHIRAELKIRPAICYCNLLYKDYLTTAGQKFTHIHESEHIDDDFLRHLDSTHHLIDGLFPLIVVTTQFGMRGIDYRASTLGITLFNYASYDNMREALQGLCRVGRFGDHFKIYMVEGIALIDTQKQLDYDIKLMKFCDAATTNKVTMSASLGCKNLSKKSMFAPHPSSSKTAPKDPMYEKYFPVQTRSDKQKKAKRDGESFYDDDDYHYSSVFNLYQNLDLKKEHMEKRKKEKEKEKERRR